MSAAIFQHGLGDGGSSLPSSTKMVSSPMRTMHFHGTETVVDIKTALWVPPTGAESDILQPGQYTMPFSFSTKGLTLPPNLQGAYGKITYALKASIDRPWKWDHRTFLPITLLPVCDCNDPRFDTPLERQEVVVRMMLIWTFFGSTAQTGIVMGEQGFGTNGLTFVFIASLVVAVRACVVC